MNRTAVNYCIFFLLCIISVFKHLIIFVTTRTCLSDLFLFLSRAPIMHLYVLVLVIYLSVNTFCTFVMFLMLSVVLFYVVFGEDCS